MTTLQQSGKPFSQSSWKSPTANLGGIHSLTAILSDPVRYATNHGGSKFVRSSCLLLYDKNIANNASTIVQVCGEAAHCTRLNNFASYKAAKCGAAKFLLTTVNETWYANLKDADTFYMTVLAINIMAFLDANSRGLHTIGMLTFQTNMHGYYVQANGIPQYIIMLEEVQRRACPLPISNSS